MVSFLLVVLIFLAVMFVVNHSLIGGLMLMLFVLFLAFLSVLCEVL